MIDDSKNVKAHQTERHIITEFTKLPQMDGISRGYILTGFTEIKKVICVNSTKKTYYVERELPFSVMFLDIGFEESGNDAEDLKKAMEQMARDGDIEDIIFSALRDEKDAEEPGPPEQSTADRADVQEGKISPDLQKGSQEAEDAVIREEPKPQPEPISLPEPKQGQNDVDTIERAVSQVLREIQASPLFADKDGQGSESKPQAKPALNQSEGGYTMYFFNKPHEP